MAANINSATELEEKIQQLQAAISDARQKEAPTHLPALFKKLGQAYLESGDAPAALTEFNEALKIVSKTSDQEALAQLLGFKGLALKLIGNYPLALQAFRKSNATAAEIKHAQLTCDSFIQIGMLQSETGKVTEAISSLSKAMGLAVDQRDTARKMRVCSLLADNFFKLDSFDKAVEYYVLAYEAARELGNHAAESSFLTKVGNIFLLEQEIESAIGQYERALKIASNIQDRSAEINILGGLFRAQALAGNSRLAIVYAGQVIQLAVDIRHFEAAIVGIKTLAAYLIDQGQAEKAIPHLEQGFQIGSEQANLAWQMELLEQLGLAFHEAENFKKSLQSYQKGLDLAIKMQDLPSEAVLLGHMTAVYADDGDVQTSIETAQKALALAEVLEDRKLAAEQHVLQAFNYRETGQKEKAIESCKAAIVGYQSLEDSEMITHLGALLEELEN